MSLVTKLWTTLRGNRNVDANTSSATPAAVIDSRRRGFKLSQSERLERDRAIIEIARSNPESSLQEIGDKYHLTRERVRQILNKAKVVKANSAAIRSARLKDQKRLYCFSCGEPRGYSSSFVSGREKSRMNNCKKCQLVDVSCSICDSLFKRRPAELYKACAHPNYTGMFAICGPKCMKVYRQLAGKALGSLPAGPKGRRESNDNSKKEFQSVISALLIEHRLQRGLPER